jgi:hypothetical protein
MPLIMFVSSSFNTYVNLPKKKNPFKERGDDAIQPSKDLLEVPVDPVTRLRAKKFKEAFNGLLQYTWARWTSRGFVIIKSKP